MEYVNTPIGLIHPSPTNPRKSFPAEEMAEMIDSVKRHGILQPILVREWPATYAFDGEWPPKYELIAGERRYRAAKGAELDSIPVMVRQLNDNEVLEIQIIENLQRKGLHEIEEAEGYELMIKDHGYTADELAEKIGKSRAYIYGRMKLTALCMGARLAFRDRKLTASTALLIARIPDEKMQMEAIDKITGTWEGIMSFRRASEVIQSNFCFNLDKAPFPQENPMLWPAAGTCSACPKRSGNSPELCPDTNRTDVCTDPRCFKDKSAAWMSYQAGQAKKEGKKVIVGTEAEKIDIEYSSGPYEKLDSKNFSIILPGKDQHSTNREILEFLGDKAPESILIENQRKGAMVEAVSNDQLKKALKEAGLAKSNAVDPAQQKLDQQAKEETETREALFLAMREGLKRDFEDRGPGLETDEMRIIARHYWTALWHESKKTVARLWVAFAANDTARIDDVTEMIRTTDSTGVLLRLMMDMAISGQINVPSYFIDKPCEDLDLMATSVGIDLEEFRQAHKAAKTAPTKSAKSISTPPKAPLGAGSERELDDTPKVGDRVRVKEGVKGAAGQLRKCCGREGDIEAQRGPFFAVRFAPGKSGVVADLTREEFDLLPAPITFSTASEPAPTPSKAARARVMYRHPKHETLEWSGRGKQPMWVANWINDGGDLEALRVQGEEQKQSSAADASNAKPAMAECAPRCTKTLELPLA